MLSRLKVRNFKSIGDAGLDLELKPLTILVGPNGSGKSTIIEALAVVGQSMGTSMRIQGELASFESPADLVHKGSLDRRLLLEVHDSAGAGFRYETKYDTGEARVAAISAGKEIMAAALEGNMREGLKLIQELPGGKRQVKVERGADQIGWDRYAFVQVGSLEKWPQAKTAESIIESLSFELMGRVFLLADSRGTITPAVSVPNYPRWVGKTGEGLIPILTLIMNPQYEEVADNIRKWATKFGLAKLWAGPSEKGAGSLSAKYRDPELGHTLNLAAAGRGSKQILSVITQLFYAPLGSVILIEEPELSLHPQSQVLVCDLFAEALKENKQVIFTTHSSYSLLSLSKAVSQKKLSAKDVAVYEITKGQKGTSAKRMKLNKEGYIEGWVASFAKAEKDLLSDWLRAIERETE